MISPLFGPAIVGRSFQIFHKAKRPHLWTENSLVPGELVFHVLNFLRVRDVRRAPFGRILSGF